MTAHARGLPFALAATVLAVLAPWPFASVEPLFQGLFAALLLAVAAAALIRGAVRGPVAVAGGSRGLVAGALALPGVALLAAVPLPRALVELLSPETVGTLARAAPPVVPTWLPLTLDLQATLDAATVAAAVTAVLLLVGFAAARGGSRALAWTFVAGGGLLAVFGLLQRLIQPDPTVMFWSVELNETGTPFGSYVNRNHFGGAMLLFVGVAVGLAVAARRRARTGEMRVAWAAAILLAFALLACTSRGAIVGLGALALGLVAAAPAHTRRRVGLGIAGAGVAGLIALAALGLIGDLAARAALQPRWMSRFLVQRDAVEIFLGFPLAGTGAGSFASVFPALQSIADDRHFGGAHSDWAQFLMETGLLGVTAGVLLATAIARRVRAALRSAAAHAPTALAAGAAAGLLGLCVHGLFETNLHIPANALLAAVVAGLAWGAATEASGRPRAEAAVSSPPGLDDDDQSGAPSIGGANAGKSVEMRP